MSLIALSILNAAPVLKVTVLQVANPAPQPDARFGESVSGLGDVNGDGVADLIVGAPGDDRVDIISGATRLLIRTINDPDGLTGNRFGFSVASAGDVDGDGVEDVAVGAPGPSPSPIPLPCPVGPCPPPDPAWGRAFVVSGSTGGLIHKITPVTDFVGFGVSVASPGDVSGDGIPDLAVGMVPFGFASAVGRVYAFSGSNKAQLWVTDEPGGKQVASFGLHLASVADLTSDGRPDLLVSAPFHDVDPDPDAFLLAGEAYLLSGATGSIVRTHTNPTPADNDLYGSGLAGVDDQDSDGSEDYAIGEAGAGLVHRITGATGASAGTLAAPATAESFGFSLAAVGDQDGDGMTDFWVAAPGSGEVHLRTWSGTALAMASDPANGPPGSFGWSIAGTGNLGGDAPADLIVGSPASAGGSGLAFVILLAANKPPIANAGPDQVVECAGSTGTPVVLDGSASSDPDGDPLTYTWRDATNAVVGTAATASLTLGLGTHSFTLTVSDGFESSMDVVSITVSDTTAPALSVTVDPASLWPPNHRLVSVAASITASDACDPSPSITLVSVTSSEPDDASGDGETGGDIQGAALGTDDRSVLLRAERSGIGSGRVYWLMYSAEDASGNTSTATAAVNVPVAFGQDD